MTITVPNYQIPIVDQQQRMTPQFLKFLGDLTQVAPGSVEANVATLETQVATLTTDVTTLSAALTALTATVSGHTTHLNALPTSRLSGSTAYDPPNLIVGATTTKTVSVTGASLGMAAEASFSLDMAGLIMVAYVSSANTVTCVLYNPTIGAVDLANGVLKAFAWNP